MTAVWAVVPAAGTGRRFGGDVPKQYMEVAGRSVIAHAVDRLLLHPAVAGAVVALSAGDARWDRVMLQSRKPVVVCVGGAERAASVLSALAALEDTAGSDVLALVHDAARPNLAQRDLDRLIGALRANDDGALLAAPVRDTLKRIDMHGRSEGTQPRDGLWRALTPQGARLGVLRDALRRAHESGNAVTDEAMALELCGRRPLLVEGREDNIKITTQADLALAEFLLSRSHTETSA